MRGANLPDHLTGGPVIAGLALVGIVAGVLVGSSGLGTVAGCGLGSDLYPSQTAEDWVDQADHVVVATPVKERTINRHDYPNGIFEYKVERQVSLKAEDSLWTSKQPERSLGDEFDLVAPGWRVFRETGNRFKDTNANAPRLEVGHTYLLALRWVDGRWTVLGEGAALPFDDRTVGQGEWCGRELSGEDVARGERFSRPDESSLEESLHGQNARAVTRALDQASKK
ncbi:hypothetical protein ACFV0R_26635 [Streptomyces sp. NPDC059578]|uniref:hypothetical protein n=1 Tax=Streptomyces sp. NPDC059578 TaxID=3346874 RepID=UPI0036B4EEF6